MSEEVQVPLPITIGDQTFRIRARPGEETRYARVQELANHTLREIQAGGVIGGPRTLAMAVFQLAVELDEARESLRRSEQSRDRLSELIRRIDRAAQPRGAEPLT